MPKEIIVPKSTVKKYKFDHKTVPILIQFVTESNNANVKKVDHNYCVASCDPFHVLLTYRPYRKKMLREDAIAFVRKERKISKNAQIKLIFFDHPREFFPIACEAWSEAYRRKRPALLEKRQKVLDLVSDFDPRRGQTYESVKDWL